MKRTVVFGSLKLGAQPFRLDKDNSVTTVFGSCEIDLRQAEMEPVTNIKVITVFGNTRLIVPEDLEIHLVSGFSLAGDSEIKHYVKKSTTESTKALNIDASTAFGGLEVLPLPSGESSDAIQ